VIRFQLLVPAVEYAVVAEPSAGDPFSISPQLIGSLLERPPQKNSGHRVRVQGVVALLPSGELSISDETGSLTFKTEMASIPPGSLIDVLGFLTHAESKPILEDAVFREIDDSSLSSDKYNHTSRVSEQPGKLRVLETVSQVHSLTPAESGRNYPVHLRGVVTYYTRAWKFAFIQDRTGGIFINTSASNFDLKPGQLIEVDGQSGPGDFAPVVEQPKLRILGEAPMPVAPKLSIDDLLTGQHDSDWVEAEGILQTVTYEEGHVFLGIVSGSHKFKAPFPR
jgi:hypothetical protein